MATYGIGLDLEAMELQGMDYVGATIDVVGATVELIESRTKIVEQKEIYEMCETMASKPSWYTKCNQLDFSKVEEGVNIP